MVASNPGQVRLSRAKIERFRPELFRPMRPGGWPGLRADHANKTAEQLLEEVATYLEEGDSRAAVVVGVSPLRVAAYSDELDCVMLLRFDAPVGPQLVVECRLELGSRLLAINTYGFVLHTPADL